MISPVTNLEKQIKRHVIGRSHALYAVTAPGLEKVCARELTQLSDTIRIEALTPGGVVFNGRLDDLMRGNLHVHTAGRLLMRITAFNATNFRQFRKKAAAVPWDRYLPDGSVPRSKVTAHQSRLYHSRAVAEHLAGAVADHWDARNSVAQVDPGQTIHVRLEQDTATLSLDSSGANLYLRGIKTHGARAPLRETLAAGILKLADYDASRPLLDPMCGAGTFSLEAALISKQIPPGRFREFAFMRWPAFRPKRWNHLTALADQSIRAPQRPLIFSSDQDAAACRRLASTIRRFDLVDAIQLDCLDFFELKPPADSRGDLPLGLMVLNPPYGRRLDSDRNLQRLYARIGEKMRSDFRGWRAAVILPHADLIRTLPLYSPPIRLVHGGLTLYLLVGTIS
jgi:putative N6-adenine-specific DNA methylase